MKIEELTREQQEQAKACKTKEEIMAFIRENNIELSAEQMQQITGGVDKCPGDRRGKEKTSRECSVSPSGNHDWVFTGQTRPGAVFGNLWHDKLYKCACCGEKEWRWIYLD